ncbi:small integral membrane protein 8-like [Mercenaria mercenaria]|uniref:small integral membrane protein 8-like n=1 Tax=Mercenaria mercenaria TaxID=6596 RepID=UPI001E1E10B9|nr:small integral membrane protein 8-like [Mercenaria mercenaria]
MAEEHNKSNASTKTEAKEPGLRGVKTTNIFRMVNFELFAKPNKRVMGLGGFAFLAACGYILYIRLTDEYKDVPTYTTISDDGSLTRRVKHSKWD